MMSDLSQIQDYGFMKPTLVKGQVGAYITTGIY